MNSRISDFSNFLFEILTAFSKKNLCYNLHLVVMESDKELVLEIIISFA